MAASCVRAQMLRADGPNGQAAAELADAFCRQSRLRVERLFDALWTNTDAADERLSRAILDGRYKWFEEDVLDTSEGTGPWIAESGAEPRESVARRFL